MGKITGFLEFEREKVHKEPIAERLKHWREFEEQTPADVLKRQGARAGHLVTLFERDDRVGGLLRYGIPDFKMEKWLIDRRMEQMAAEGVTFQTSVDVGRDVTGAQLRRDFDAVVLSCGATKPRDLP